MPPSQNPDLLLNLHKTLTNTTTILITFLTTLDNPTNTFPPPNAPTPLSLLHDTASLLKAHVTKLSLLTITKPFSAREITHVLIALHTSILPALVSCIELSPPSQYSKVLHGAIRTGIERTLRELLVLIGSIPHDEHGIGKTRQRDTLPSTGVVWECCDALIALAKDGLVALAVRKVEEYHALLQDAISELEEWDPDAESDISDNEDDEDIDTSVAANGALETSMRSLDIAPTSKINILVHLRLIRLLYPALIKRRLRRFPTITATSVPSNLPMAHQLQTLDALMEHTRYFSEETDEIAGALYAQDTAGVDSRLNGLRTRAIECVKAVKFAWEGEEDEFTVWSGQWEDRLRELDGVDVGGWR